MIQIDYALEPKDFEDVLSRFWELSAAKILLIEQQTDAFTGTPVFTRNGKYTSQGWTDWTQGFQFGSAILQADATSDNTFLELGRRKTLTMMTPHITHFGVHDHGFNNLSTYGNLWRLMNEGKIPENTWERAYYELALKCSGAVQAKRWTSLKSGEGFIYSFNGPHSLFIDTIRTLRILGVAHLLGHVVKDEGDRSISLLGRMLTHLITTAKYNVYYGEDRDTYDICGRVAHEAIFNVNNGDYRCPNTQQGFSPFTTWTRGLAWAILGFAEQLEFLDILNDDEIENLQDRVRLKAFVLRAAKATADFYLKFTPSDGIPYWDTGAPGLHRMSDSLERPADPYNPYEPVDSSAAVITAQGLLRLGQYLQNNGAKEEGKKYWQAGLTVLKRVFEEPYLSVNEQHEGLILHSIYHRPNGWDCIPPDQRVPCGEATLWGDYHAREVAVYLQRIIKNKTYLTFWGNFQYTQRRRQNDHC